MRLSAITALIAPYRRSDGAACRFRLDFPTHCGKRHRSCPHQAASRRSARATMSGSRAITRR